MKMILCQNFLISMMKLLHFTKNIKIERTCKELLEDIVTLVEKSEITKELQDNLKLVVWKKVLVKISNWHGFLMKTTKHKAILPL